jgi:carbon storage regulator
MLCLSRKVNEKVLIAGGAENGGITITVIETSGERCKLGIDAPRSVEIHRQEVWVKIQREGKAA